MSSFEEAIIAFKQGKKISYRRGDYVYSTLPIHTNVPIEYSGQPFELITIIKHENSVYHKPLYLFTFDIFSDEWIIEDHK